MACNCVCTCPLEAGDHIRFKLNPNSSMPTVRCNGALRLTLMYYGPEYVVYKWENPEKGGWPGGEGMLTRQEFDEQCERAPKGWKPGRDRPEV